MAVTVEECRRMIEACKENRVQLMIAYRKYFEPGSIALTKLAASGKLGPLKHIYSVYTEIVDPKRAFCSVTRPELC